MKTPGDIEDFFTSRFHSVPRIFIAPGRINLIGEHVDYNEGFVLPAAIEHHITFAIAPNGTDQVNCFAIDYNESASFPLELLQPGDSWVNYLMGVMAGLRAGGANLHGVDCVFGSSIPVGAGLSSSAALCCGFGFALNSLFDYKLSKLDIAHIGQYAEHNFAGVMCGIMDQFASVFGEKEAALLLDCRSMKYDILPVHLGDYQLLLIDSKVKHSLASTAYNDRRKACEEGVRLIGKYQPEVKSLRDVTSTMLLKHQDELGEDVFTKCRFIVEEIARTQTAALLLKSNGIEEFGKLLFETHWGLSRSYDVSCEELDFLVSSVEGLPDIVGGARMMGGGFGGCTINLVKKDKMDYLKGYIHEIYVATFEKEPDFYSVNLAAGVHELQRPGV